MMLNMNSSYSIRMRRSYQTKQTNTKPILLVLDDVEYELVVEEADETEATKPNQRVVAKINLLVLDDVEHELIEQGDETEAAKPKNVW